MGHNPTGTGVRFPPFGRGERGMPHNRGMMRGGPAGRGMFGRGDGMFGRGQAPGRGIPAQGGVGPAFPQRGMPPRGAPQRTGVPLGRGDPNQRDNMLRVSGQGLPPPLLDDSDMKRFAAAQRRDGPSSQDTHHSDQNIAPGGRMSEPRDFQRDDDGSGNLYNSYERFGQEEDTEPGGENISPSPFEQDQFVEEPAVNVTPQPEADDEEGELVEPSESTGLARDHVDNAQPKASVFLDQAGLLWGHY